jgi:hypothetical protein
MSRLQRCDYRTVGAALDPGRLPADREGAERTSSTGIMIAHYERGGKVKVADTALAEPSKAEAARQERMKREG